MPKKIDRVAAFRAEFARRTGKAHQKLDSPNVAAFERAFSERRDAFRSLAMLLRLEQEEVLPRPLQELKEQLASQHPRAMRQAEGVLRQVRGFAKNAMKKKVNKKRSKKQAKKKTPKK